MSQTYQANKNKQQTINSKSFEEYLLNTNEPLDKGYIVLPASHKSVAIENYADMKKQIRRIAMSLRRFNQKRT